MPKTMPAQVANTCHLFEIIPNMKAISQNSVKIMNVMPVIKTENKLACSTSFAPHPDTKIINKMASCSFFKSLSLVNEGINSRDFLYVII